MGKKEYPLVQHPLSCSYSHASTASMGSTASSSARSRSRVASEDLVVPPTDNVNSIYYGVDAFSPTLVDFYTVDQKRILWSSRAHRKMMTTLYRAWHGKCWKLYSLSFWGSSFAILAHTLFVIGFFGESIALGDKDVTEHGFVDIPLFVGALCYLAWHVLNYLEVINCCHNLEIWLDEYLHGQEPLLERQYVGFFPSRIDFWTELLGMLGSVLFVLSRLYILVRSDGTNFGVIDVGHSEFGLIMFYWVPFFAGAFLLLLSAYLGHVEVVHQWFSWRLTTLETWVTGLTMLSMVGFFLASTLQFMDPFSVLFSFEDCMVPFGLGCFLGLAASFLSMAELEQIHKRHKHPEYGLLRYPSGYGSTWA
uniref:Uncharacterized protein n=1 Tax=Globisporangium ultimum (strain ATCC 200006 / CBS 805.95 / DAOM BR144) TaxID=431595 RepID=K3WGV1_GLOUD